MNPQSTGDTIVLGIHALSCHGFGTDWLATLVAVPPAIIGCAYRPLSNGLVYASRLEFTTAAFPPPVPPPRPALT